MRPTCSLVALAVLGCLIIGTAEAHAETAVVLVVGKAQAKDRTTVASAVRSAARSGGGSGPRCSLANRTRVAPKY